MFTGRRPAWTCATVVLLYQSRPVRLLMQPRAASPIISMARWAGVLVPLREDELEVDDATMAPRRYSPVTPAGR